MEVPELRYARSGDLRLAYQQWGSGPPLLIIPPLLSNIELSWEHELYRRVHEYNGRRMEVLQFDKRGIGLSDRPEQMPTLSQRIEDIGAVMDAAGWESATLLGLSEGAAMAQLFAAEHPERVERVVLMNGMAPLAFLGRLSEYARPGDPPIPTLEEILARFGELAAGWPENTSEFIDWFMPSQNENTTFVRWVARLQRMSASPKDFSRQIESVLTLDAGDAPGRITCPALVIHVTGDRVIHVSTGRMLAEAISGARYVEVPGDDHFLWVMPQWRDLSDLVAEFVTGSTVTRSTSRRFATVLFTDIVDSTRRSAEMGDNGWRTVLASHDRIAGEVVARHGGRVVKSTGDGLLAVFDMPSQGVACGTELCRALRAIDVSIRAGVHAGEIEVHDDGDISGIAVNLAARVEQAAGDSEFWVSSTVRDMMLGSDMAFADRGEHDLKGIDGRWRLFAVTTD